MRCGESVRMLRSKPPEAMFCPVGSKRTAKTSLCGFYQDWNIQMRYRGSYRMSGQLHNRGLQPGCPRDLLPSASTSLPHNAPKPTACISAPFCAELLTTATAWEEDSSGRVRLTSWFEPNVSGALRLSGTPDIFVIASGGAVFYTASGADVPIVSVVNWK